MCIQYLNIFQILDGTYYNLLLFEVGGFVFVFPKLKVFSLPVNKAMDLRSFISVTVVDFFLII